jgi:hypothetical protein
MKLGGQFIRRRYLFRPTSPKFNFSPERAAVAAIPQVSRAVH